MTAYWLYCRLNVHVSATDDDLMAALDAYADAHVKGGAAVLTDEHRAAIRREHDDALVSFLTVQAGV